MAGFDNIFEDANRRRHEERIVSLEEIVARLLERVYALEEQTKRTEQTARSAAESSAPDGRYSHR